MTPFSCWTSHGMCSLCGSSAHPDKCLLMGCTKGHFSVGTSVVSSVLDIDMSLLAHYLLSLCVCVANVCFLVQLVSGGSACQQLMCTYVFAIYIDIYAYTIYIYMCVK